MALGLLAVSCAANMMFPYGNIGTFPSLAKDVSGLTEYNARIFALTKYPSDSVWRINPKLPADETGNYGKVGDLPSGLTHGGGLLRTSSGFWVVDYAGDDLWRIDPDDPDNETGGYGKVGDLPSNLRTPTAILEDGSDLLIFDANGDELWRIDPDDPDNILTGGYGKVGDLPSGLNDLQGATWSKGKDFVYLVSKQPGGTPALWRIDPDDPDNETGNYGKVGDLPSGLNDPHGLTLLHGYLLVANRKIVSGDYVSELWIVDKDNP